eukprot:scaffold17375_cov102-Isochrysis_galbana.AAC.9
MRSTRAPALLPPASPLPPPKPARSPADDAAPAPDPLSPPSLTPSSPAGLWTSLSMHGVCTSRPTSWPCWKCVRERIMHASWPHIESTCRSWPLRGGTASCVTSDPREASRLKESLRSAPTLNRSLHPRAIKGAVPRSAPRVRADRRCHQYVGHVDLVAQQRPGRSDAHHRLRPAKNGVSRAEGDGQEQIGTGRQERLARHLLAHQPIRARHQPRRQAGSSSDSKHVPAGSRWGAITVSAGAVPCRAALSVSSARHLEEQEEQIGRQRL